MLQLRPRCECCDTDLSPESTEARICSFECTFCAACADGVLAGNCPNCKGELVARPRRPAIKLAKFPASTERIVKQHGCTEAATPLTLYFSPNSISLAIIIVLEEIGVPYVLQRVELAKGEQRSAGYLELNPLGRVPTLRTQDGLLTETTAILTYLARSAPAAELLPTGAFLEARAISFISYLASTVHVAHAHRMRGSRWSDDAGAIASMQRRVPQSVLDAFSIIEQNKLEGPWVLGDQFSVCDPHLFTIAQWLEADGVDTTQLPRVLDHRARMLQRPATQRALVAEYTGSPATG